MGVAAGGLWEATLPPATPGIKSFCIAKNNRRQISCDGHWEGNENYSHTHGQFLKNSIVKGTVVTEDFRKAAANTKQSTGICTDGSVNGLSFQSTGGKKHFVFHLQKKVRHPSIKTDFSFKGTVLPINIFKSILETHKGLTFHFQLTEV